MPNNRQALPHALALFIFSAGTLAQESPTLKEAVRDQYVDAMDENELDVLDGAAPFSGMDAYSHFLSEQELRDGSVAIDSAAFARALGAGALYLRIPVFHVKTSAQVRQQLSAAMKTPGMKTVVIDLRGNRGGLLNAAIEVADEFIADGELASTKGRHDSANLVFLAKPGGLAERVDIAVLVDKRTASAAELLAGILRINAGARLIGQNTFGKSAVQTQIRLKDGGALSLTTATFFFADGSTVGVQGLSPDAPVSAWRLWRHPPAGIQQTEQGMAVRNALLSDAVNSAGRH
jgi:C-terminal processing protease CtpA/Prc